MRIFLVGFMGAGKTTLGRKLARKLELKFIDLDREIEKKFQKSVVEIFTSDGEEQFRAMELDVLNLFLKSDNYVMATGGGTPCFGNVMETLNNFGTTLYVKSLPEILANRLSNAYIERPLLRNKTPEEMLEFVNKTLGEREPVYSRAHFTLNGDEDYDLDQLARNLLLF